MKLFEIIILTASFLIEIYGSRRNRAQRNAYYSQQQSTASPNGIQCPCVKPTSGGDCFAYDNRFLATSIEEALASFADLTYVNSNDNLEIELPAISTMMDCTTPDCMQCRDDLAQRLVQVGMIDASMVTVTNATTTSVCSKYRFTSNDPSNYEWGKPTKNTYKKYDKCGEDNDSDSEDDCDSKEEDKKNKSKKNNHRRRKRQAGTPTPLLASSLGTRFNISCTAKGFDTDNTGTLNLCNKCWTWRKLPDNYFPNFINELVCDTTDVTCLSGFAKCSVGTRSLEVLRKDTNTKVTLTTGAFCECRVFANSAFSALVSGAPADSNTIIKTIASAPAVPSG
uniref:Gnk2-homologous domain-containing protein n=1 Tax=Rhabditophanes sp. KR3021 TaxID=114890 RepID=A0AC35TJU6_9BILA